MLFQLRWLGSAEKDSMLFDNTFRGSKYKSKNENFDYKKKLLEEKKINKDFLNRIKLITLEELVYLKLDSIGFSFINSWYESRQYLHGRTLPNK